MTLVKICGIQGVAEALAAAQAGADYVGIIFVPGMRRRMPEEQARTIIAQFREARGDRDTPKVVGLFADQPLEEVNRIAQECQLEMVQLCGHESPQYCRQMIRPVIKVLHVPENGAPAAVVRELSERMREYIQAGCQCTLDKAQKGQPGGTGRLFNWTVAKELATSYPFLLAGGLTPENVGVAVREVAPWGVDVSSGVETGRVKDTEKITAFVQAVRQSAQGG